MRVGDLEAPRPAVSDRRSIAYRSTSDVGTWATISISPWPTAPDPWIRPRFELRSPIRSPWYCSGAVTTSSLTGSSRIGVAFAIASLNPSDPAILKLISDESTEWYLPSKHVTFTSTTG